jgi:MFS family permease
MGVLFLFPLMLQQIRGLDATQSGLVTVAQVLGMFLVMPNSAKLYAKLGARTMMVIGFTVMVLTIGSMEFVNYDSSLWLFRAQLFIFGIGLAFAFIPLQTVTFQNVSMHDTANASALFSTSRQIASAVGVSIVSSVLTLRTDAHLGSLAATASDAMIKTATFDAYQNTFLFSGACALIGIAFAFVFKRQNSTPAGTAPVTAEGEVREAVMVH